MNIKRYSMAVVAVFAFFFFAEWFVHGSWLAADYEATSAFWRSEAQMQSLYHFILLGQLLMAVMFCFLFVKDYENRGLLEGARFGSYIALLLASGSLVMYVVQPFPADLVIKWVISSSAELVIAGMIAAGIYKN